MDSHDFKYLLRQTLLNEISTAFLRILFLKETFKDPFNDDPNLPMIETLFGFAEDYHPQSHDFSPFDVDEATLRQAILDAWTTLIRFMAAHPEHNGLRPP